ncbi:MAG: PfkB family carbohydrate kinase [Propionibacteriaceae bacterium]|jgi:2-dehydro-3-deoxygluconokinase|nr:PfkB family carbohydrate kinase [Propionibacteriaceae bacterium]
MQLRADAQWSLVVPTSMGIRITPQGSVPVHLADQYTMQATSAESNVASICGYLGEPSLVLTNFVADSPISAMIKASLRRRGLSYLGPDLPQGGPWGYRHQFNIADSGFGSRAPRVWNDRAGEVGLELSVEDYDLEDIFGRQGVKILHLSGLVAALSPKTARFCVELAKDAKGHGTIVSMDMNYRASFWRGREIELRQAFTTIASLCDILIGNEEDFQLALGIPGPQAGGEGLAEKTESFRQMIDSVRDAYPQAQFVATTLREVIAVDRHLWGMVVFGDGEFHVAPPREIGVLDRIGGGDGSVGGLLYGILKGWDADAAMRFGWATGALAAASWTDYALPADEAQVWGVWQGNARVQR